MYTLLYPAVLGTMIVAVIASTIRDDLKIEMFTFCWNFALFLALYFSTQHVQNTLDEPNYTGVMFISGLAEIGSMYWLFLWLGLIRPESVISGEANDTWFRFYALLAVVFLLPVAARFWNLRDENRNPWRRVFPVGTGDDDIKMLAQNWMSRLSIFAAVLSIPAYLFYPTEWFAPIPLCIPLALYVFRIIFHCWPYWPVDFWEGKD